MTRSARQGICVIGWLEVAREGLLKVDDVEAHGCRPLWMVGGVGERMPMKGAGSLNGTAARTSLLVHATTTNASGRGLRLQMQSG